MQYHVALVLVMVNRERVVVDLFIRVVIFHQFARDLWYRHIIIVTVLLVRNPSIGQRDASLDCSFEWKRFHSFPIPYSVVLEHTHTKTIILTNSQLLILYHIIESYIYLIILLLLSHPSILLD